MRIQSQSLFFLKRFFIVVLCVSAIFKVGLYFARDRSISRIKNLVASSFESDSEFLDYIGGQFSRESILVFKSEIAKLGATDMYMIVTNSATKDEILRRCRSGALALKIIFPNNDGDDVFILRMETDTVVRINSGESAFLFFFGNAVL